MAVKVIIILLFPKIHGEQLKFNGYGNKKRIKHPTVLHKYSGAEIWKSKVFVLNSIYT